MGDDYKDYTITIGSADESVSTYKWGSLDPTYTVCTSDLSDTITLDNLTTEDYITKNFLDQTTCILLGICGTQNRKNQRSKKLSQLPMRIR